MGEKITKRDIPYLEARCVFRNGIEGKNNTIWVLEDRIVICDVNSRFHEIGYDEIESINIKHPFGSVGLDVLSLTPNKSNGNSLMRTLNSKFWTVNLVALKSQGKFEAEETSEFRSRLVSYVEEKIKAASVN